MRCLDAHTDIWSDVTVRRLRGETEVLRRCHLDRLRRGGVEGGVFAFWVDPPFDQTPAARTRQMMACVAAELAECGEVRKVCTCGEMDQARADGKIYAWMGVEGMAAIGTDLGGIDDYYDFGVRHAMLTWNEENALGAGAATGRDTGLTTLGKQAVRRLQDRGMLVDVSHLNEAGFWDVVRLAQRPIIASHSNARALCDVPRNLTDAQLRAIRDLGGVVGLNVYHRFLDIAPGKQSVEMLACHGAHMIEVMGIDHVGCGFDFCEFLHPDAGGDAATLGLEDCSQIGNLFACFEKMGMTGQEQEQVAYGNFQRVFRQTIG